MEDKIKVAFIYKPSYEFLTGKHFDNTTYFFFLQALQRNPQLDISYFQEEVAFDIKSLNDQYDIILIPNNYHEGTPELIGIEKSKIPVISRVGDPHDAKQKKKHEYHEKFKIDYYFNFMDKSYFYKFYPRDYKYKTIIFGLEPSLYYYKKSFKDRIKDRILISGAIGKTNLKSRIANRVLNPHRSGWYFYKLRTLCNNLPYVEHARDIENKFPINNYQYLLSQYRGAIAATTYYPTIKYWETTAAGCLTFMEISELNQGQYLGYKNNKTAIFINEKNYKEKFEEYLNDIDNPKWEEIAKAGEKYTISELNNDKAVNSLVDLMKIALK